MTTVERPRYKVVGTRPIRHDGVDKVTGRARYGADIRLPGTLEARVVRSPHAHARIKSIDISRAAALPGVRAIITGADMPIVSGRSADQAEGSFVNYGLASMNIMAREKAVYRGHPVAAVAADSATIADEAIRLIEVQYDLLEPMMNSRAAMAEGAQAIIPGLKMQTALGAMADLGSDGTSTSNIAAAFTIELGDPAQGFEQADVILERHYSIGGSHQGYIEPQSGTASWSADGKLTIWCSSQGHFMVRDFTASVLGISADDVKVVQMEIGGGFGGKIFPVVEPIAALLSKKAGRLVRLSLSRAEVFDAIGGTSAAEIDLKMGFTSDGKIVAADARLVFEAGAFPGSPVGAAANCMLAPYAIPNARIEGFDVLVNKPKSTAYRAPGAPSGAFAVESMLDEFCQQMNLDPVEFRLQNAAVKGTRRANGVPMPSVGVVEVLQAVKASDHWNAPLAEGATGRGMSVGFWGNGGGQASMLLNVLPNGDVSLVEGSPDIGGTRAAAAMMVAERLGLDAAAVHPSIGDTESIGFTSLTGGSTTAFKQGAAADAAASDLLTKLTARVASIWKVEPDEVIYDGGVFRCHNDELRELTFKDLARRLNQTGGPIFGAAAVSPTWPAPSVGAHIADVAVDPETGKTQILRYSSIIDAGTAIHPSYVEGQMQGGAAQGIGWALTEEYIYNADGRMENSSYLDYRMPTTLDLPLIDTTIVEVPTPGHPFGVRGVGEIVIVPPLATVGNAIARATGVRMNEIPMNPTRVLAALQDNQR